MYLLLVFNAIFRPLSLAPGIDTAYGMPVIRGDRAALLYEGTP